MIVTPWNIEQIDDTYAKEVQSNLLKIILYTTFTLSLLSAFLASIKILPFGNLYIVTLIAYTSINFIAYKLIQKDEHHYELVVNILVYSSLLTFVTSSNKCNFH